MSDSRTLQTSTKNFKLISKGIHCYLPDKNQDITFVCDKEIDGFIRSICKNVPSALIEDLKSCYQKHLFPFEKVFLTIQDCVACVNIIAVPTTDQGRYDFSTKDFIAAFPDINSLLSYSYIPLADRGFNVQTMLKARSKGFKV